MDDSSPAARPSNPSSTSKRASSKPRSASLTTERDQAEKAVSDAKTEHDRIVAETATAQQSAEAIKQQMAALDQALAGRKAEQAKLDKQTSDLTATLASLTTERDQAEKALSDIKAEHDRIWAEKCRGPATRRSAPAKGRLSRKSTGPSRAPTVPPAPDQLQKVRADVSERRDAEQRVATLQDQLRQAEDEKAAEQRALAEAKAEHDRISAETATGSRTPTRSSNGWQFWRANWRPANPMPPDRARRTKPGMRRGTR